MATSEQKRHALAEYLEEDIEDVEDLELETDEYQVGSAVYTVLTYEEADALAREAILDSLWAFKKEFLNAHSSIINNISNSVWEQIINSLCEDANEMILRLIDDLKHFVDDAILADGRGHFLSWYDGEELELDNDFFAYRIN